MKTFHLTTKYVDDDVFIEAGRYHDGSLALRLLTDTGEPASIATICLSHLDIKPADGNVFIKDWSENEGMLSGLIAAGIIGNAVREIPTGFAKAYECPLAIPLDDLRVRLRA